MLCFFCPIHLSLNPKGQERNAIVCNSFWKKKVGSDYIQWLKVCENGDERGNLGTRKLSSN